MFKLRKERINLKKKIGSGASGNVYPYQKDGEDSKWVVKRIHANDTDQLLSFLPEIVLGFSCDHPCIVPLKGYNIEKTEQDDYYIYLKFPRMKETLKEKFDAQKKMNKPFSEEELAKYFYAMVCAVDYLHKKKIYHRDIKPGNVLLDESRNAMLSDVGVAKHVGDEEIYQPLTGQGGTVDYTAPELLKDKFKLTKENLIQGDAWSLGLVMLELCILKNRLLSPYSAQEKIEEVQKSLYDKLKEIYPKTLLELIFKLLKFQPNERIKISDLKQKLEVEYKCCLNSELKPENEERKENDPVDIETHNYLGENQTQEMSGFVQSLLQENSQLQNQLKEYKSLLNQFHSELDCEKDETAQKLSINFQETFKKFYEFDGTQGFKKGKDSPSEKQDEEEINRNLLRSNESDREEKKEHEGGEIGTSQTLDLREKNSGRNKFIYKKASKVDGEVKLVVIGLNACGKTDLVESLMSRPFNFKKFSTIGASFFQLTLDRDEKKLLFNIWDAAGEGRYLSMLGMYLRKSSVVIIVYDICERISFDKVPDLIKRAKDHNDDSLILFIVGNKLDLVNERQVLKVEAEEFARKQGAIHLEVSALTRENIDELREKLADAIWEKYAPLSQGESTIKKSGFWNFFG